MSQDDDNPTLSPLTSWPTNEPRHAHLDCFSGIAGDMLLAACLDVGGPSLAAHVVSCLKQGLPAMSNEFTLQHKRVWRSHGGIAATHVTVTSIYGDQAAPVPAAATQAVPSQEQGHSHSHGHSHGHGHSHDHEQSHQEQHAHEHAHGHSHEPSQQASSSSTDDATHSHSHSHHHSHHHDASSSTTTTTTLPPHGPLRNLPEIRQMLQQAPAVSVIPAWVRRVAVTAFELLAAAEAHVHGADSTDAVHFHEVGAVDSLVDTIGSLLALHALGVTTVSCSALPLGTGTVRAAHGLMPVPAPATLYLMRGLPVTAGPPIVTGELVTPTGAALVRALLQECGGHNTTITTAVGGRPPRFTLRHVGMGAGTKDFPNHANVLRLLIGNNVVKEEVVRHAPSKK